MHQEAPDPVTLRRLVTRLTYKPGWLFQLYDNLDRGQGSVGATLVITVRVPNSHRHSEQISVAHYMPVPPASYDERSWRHWLLEQGPTGRATRGL